MTTPTEAILRPAPSEPLSGVWGSPNYYTTLEKRARAGAAITVGYVSMVVAAALMATAGLLLDSAAAVIGSMCVAPFMAPSRAVCIGLVYGDRRLFLGGLVKQLLGLLVMGSGLAFLMTVALQQWLDLAITSEILLRAMPTTLHFVLSVIIALVAGAAASLVLVAHPRVVESPWGQVVDAVIGVQIAISLVPPAAVIGIGLALGTPHHSWSAFQLLLVNVLCLDVLGSTIILGMRGVRRRHLDLEKRIRDTVASRLDLAPGFVSVGSTVDVTLHSEQQVAVDVIVRRRFGGKVPETLAAEIAADVAEQTGCVSDVTVEVIPLMTYSNRGEEPARIRSPKARL